MAKYAINAEGAEALRKLSAHLRQAQANIEAGAGSLWILVEKEDQLGKYGDEIMALLESNRQFLRRIGEDVSVLCRYAEEMAEKIACYLRQEIRGSGMTGNVAYKDAGIGIKSRAGFGESDMLRPVRSSPRDLPVSGFGYEEDEEGNLVYDTPKEMDAYLYKKQGSAKIMFKGTCGLCSCANIMRLAGVNATEKEMINYASKTPAANGRGLLCEAGSLDPANNGGTSPWDRKEILSHFGVESSLCMIEADNTGKPTDKNIENIASYVESGRGVILSVHAKMLWYDKDFSKNDYHAVTVTSVKRDKGGSILGFYICDSQKDGTSFYQAGKVRDVLTGSPMNVTQSIIR